MGIAVVFARMCEDYGAEAILSARLWNQMDNMPRVVPILRKAVVPVKPAPAPSKSVPPVNAPSLGADGAATATGSVRSTPHHVVPSKTPSRPKNVSPIDLPSS